MANADLMTVYQQIINSYHAIDNFRAQLLGRLPLATGAGIFLLYATNGSIPDETKAALPAIGLFGFVVTLGLFVYEVYGIMKCHALINAGKLLEGQLGIDGQFAHRPDSVLGFMNEPFAAALIYPAVLAAWAYVGAAFVGPGLFSLLIALGVFFAFLALSMRYIIWLKKDGQRADLAHLALYSFDAEETGDRVAMDKLLHPRFTLVRSDGMIQNRDQFLNSLAVRPQGSRSLTDLQVRVYDHTALITCVVTTLGESQSDRCWNTRCFVEYDGRWCCLTWQKMNILSGM